MITLYQFARTWGIPNLSHFCTKLETYLRINKLPYQIVETLPIKAPRGKLPYIEDQGRTLSDTRLIVNYLEATYGDNDKALLSSEQQGIAKAYQRLLEEHLFWASMFTRWDYTDENWQTTKQSIFSGLHLAIRDLVAAITRKKIKAQIMGHGMGRLTHDEIFALAREDIDSLADFLGDKPYFMGDKPTALDASAFGILVNTLCCPIESPLKDYALSRQNLSDYCQRMQAEFFPELVVGR